MYINFDLLYEISLFLRVKCFKKYHTIYTFRNNYYIFLYSDTNFIKKDLKLYDCKFINLHHIILNLKYEEIKNFKIQKDIFYGLIKLKN